MSNWTLNCPILFQESNISKREKSDMLRNKTSPDFFKVPRPAGLEILSNLEYILHCQTYHNFIIVRTNDGTQTCVNSEMSFLHYNALLLKISCQMLFFLNQQFEKSHCEESRWSSDLLKISEKFK